MQKILNPPDITVMNVMFDGNEIDDFCQQFQETINQYKAQKINTGILVRKGLATLEEMRI